MNDSEVCQALDLIYYAVIGLTNMKTLQHFYEISKRFDLIKGLLDNIRFNSSHRQFDHIPQHSGKYCK